MAEGQSKSEGAFLTIGELADELGLPQHILRYWETRFPQLKPLQRAGNRRYYRTQDADLARQINRLLYQEGYTVKGVQKLLAGPAVESLPHAVEPREDGALRAGLLAVRARLSLALAELDGG